jgi:hypothetical protein
MRGRSKMPFEFTIKRSFKHQIEQAIQDLQDRGYKQVSEIIERKEDRKDWDRRDRRVVFSQNSGNEKYFVRLRKVE